VLRLPVTPPAEYRLTVVVERTSPLHPSTPVQTPPPSRGPRPPTFRGRPLPFQEKPQPLPEIPQPAPASDESLDIILSVDGHPAALVLDGWQRTASGLELIDGKDVEQNGTAFHGELLPRRHNATVICTVGPGSVDAMVDGRTILHWTGPSDRLSIEAALAAEIGNNLALVASSQFRILRIELMPLGRAASLADQPPAADVALGSTAPGVAPARAALPAVPSPKALQCVALIEHPLGSGSGFAVGKKLVVTNAHVVEGVFPDEMKVRFGLENSKPQPIARILHFDRLRDLCVFELKTEAGGLPVRGEYTFAAGDRVTLVGNPAAVGDILMRNAVNRGRLSSVVRIKEQDFYQIEASVNPGWSGGPVLDGEGRVVAIVAMKAKDPIVTEIRGAMGKLDEQFRARIGRTAYQVGLTYGIPASALGAILKDPALYDAQRQAEANDRCTAKTLADRLSFLAEICMFRIQVNVPKQVRIEAQNLARGRTPAGTRRGAAQRGAIMTFMSEFEASRLRALLDEDLKSRESKFRDRLDQRIDAIQQSESLPDIIKHDLRTLAVAVREGNKFAEHPANTYGAFSTKVRSLSRDFKDHLKRLAENLKEKES
jgi:S1-C subfamily serine protease